MQGGGGRAGGVPTQTPLAKGRLVGGESTAPCRAAGSVGAKRGLERCDETGGVHQGMGGSWVVWKGHAGGVNMGSCSLLWEKGRMEEGWCCKYGKAEWA